MFEIDADAYTVTLDGSPLDLTYLEFELLRTLIMHAGRPLTRTQMLADIKGCAAEANPRTVDCHVRAIRAKLGQHRAAIRTVRGIGYLLPWAPPAASRLPTYAAAVL
jgi:DNA-binding response OmpR family regulator